LSTKTVCASPATNIASSHGINLLPAKRVAEEVMHLNIQLAQQMRETRASFIQGVLDQRFQALLRKLVDDSICKRDKDYSAYHHQRAIATGSITHYPEDSKR
jgi:hypothetical protein